MNTKAIFICTALFALGMHNQLHAESLADAIVEAYQTNPTIKAQRDQLYVLQDRYLQAEAGYAPSLSLSASSTTTSTRSGYAGGGFFPGIKTNGASLSFVQALYSGGQIRAAASAAHFEVLAGAEQARSSEMQIIREVIEAYIAVRRDQEILEIANSHVQILQKQVDNTQARGALREVTITDMATAQSRLAAAQAQAITAKGQLDISRNRYLAVVGKTPGTLEPEPELDGIPASYDEALDVLNRSNPDILQSRYTERASLVRIAEARAATMPRVDFRVNKSYGPATTLQSNIDQEELSVSIEVSKSLFSGGLNRANIAEAVDSHTRDRDRMDIADRQASKALGEAWARMLSGTSARSAYEQQVVAAQTAFNGVVEEEKVGLRSPLEVLNLEQELSNAKASAIMARHDEYSARAGVLLSMGLLDIYHLTSFRPETDQTQRYRRFYEISPTELAPRLLERLSV
ncbi:MAG: TolC family outer membrane protein, partial [Asticcacaulis sp.]